MSTINIRDIRSEKDLPDNAADINVIVFSDPEQEANGFDATCIEKNEEGFELDSAYILEPDAASFLRAVQLAKRLGWFN